MPYFRKALKRLPVASPILAGAGGSATLSEAGATYRWSAQLPVDFRRFGLETVISMKSFGCVTVHDWLEMTFD